MGNGVKSRGLEAGAAGEPPVLTQGLRGSRELGLQPHVPGRESAPGHPTLRKTRPDFPAKPGFPASPHVPRGPRMHSIPTRAHPGTTQWLGALAKRLGCPGFKS